VKKIEAIIRPAKISDVCAALEKIGHPGIMITEIEGHGKQKGIEQQFHGKTYKVELLTKAKIDLVVKDEDLDRTVKVIRESAYTGQMGDGKIFISTIDDAMRIRTGEQGSVAI